MNIFLIHFISGIMCGIVLCFLHVQYFRKLIYYYCFVFSFLS